MEGRGAQRGRAGEDAGGGRQADDLPRGGVVEEEPASGGAQRYGRGGHTSADPEHPAEQGGRDHPLQQGRLQGDVGRPDQPANGKDQDRRDGAGDGDQGQQGRPPQQGVAGQGDAGSQPADDRDGRQAEQRASAKGRPEQAIAAWTGVEDVAAVQRQGRLERPVGQEVDQGDGQDGADGGVAEQQAAGRAAAPAPADAAWLSGWYRRTGLRARVLVENDELVTRLTCPARFGMAGRVVEAVAEALGNGTWSRLRRCPDCQLVFWDRTRNASKIWCGMYAGADGRACGSIAKVRRYRARRAANGR